MALTALWWVPFILLPLLISMFTLTMFVFTGWQKGFRDRRSSANPTTTTAQVVATPIVVPTLPSAPAPVVVNVDASTAAARPWWTWGRVGNLGYLLVLIILLGVLYWFSAEALTLISEIWPGLSPEQASFALKAISVILATLILITALPFLRGRRKVVKKEVVEETVKQKNPKKKRLIWYQNLFIVITLVVGAVYLLLYSDSTDLQGFSDTMRNPSSIPVGPVIFLLLVLQVLVRFMGLFLGLLFAFILAWYLYPDFGSRVLYGIGRASQTVLGVYDDGIGPNGLRPGQAAEPYLQNNESAFVAIHPRGCDSGWADVIIPFPEGIGWRIDLNRLANEHQDLRVWKRSPTGGWRWAGPTNFHTLTGRNSRGEEYRVCRFGEVQAGVDPNVVVYLFRN